MPQNGKPRNSNFELLRIVAMMMIVLSHCTYFGVMKVGELDAFLIWNTGSCFFKIMTSTAVMGSIGVGIFFMITGYFTAHKYKTSVKKVCLVTIFYAQLIFLINIILCVYGYSYSSQGRLIIDLASLLIVPITGSVWWFVTAYIYMMIVAPFYNIFIDRLNKNGMIIWLLLLLAFCYTFGNFGSKFHDFEKAIFFYTLGVYFRDYISDSVCWKIFFAICSLLGIVLNGLCQYEVSLFMTGDVILRKMFSMISCFITEPLACIGLFGFFKGLEFKSNIINWIARRTFGVYLLHEEPLIRKFIWLHLLKPYEFMPDNGEYIIFCAMLVFMVGIIVDTIRIAIFEDMYNQLTNRFIQAFKGKYISKNNTKQLT